MSDLSSALLMMAIVVAVAICVAFQARRIHQLSDEVATGVVSGGVVSPTYRGLRLSLRLHHQRGCHLVHAADRGDWLCRIEQARGQSRCKVPRAALWGRARHERSDQYGSGGHLGGAFAVRRPTRRDPMSPDRRGPLEDEALPLTRNAERAT